MLQQAPEAVGERRAEHRAPPPRILERRIHGGVGGREGLGEHQAADGVPVRRCLYARLGQQPSVAEGATRAADRVFRCCDHGIALPCNRRQRDPLGEGPAPQPGVAQRARARQRGASELGVKPPRVDEVGLELERELTIGAGQLVGAALEHRNRLVDVAAMHEWYGQLARELRTFTDVVGVVQRGSQVLGRLRQVQRGLGMTEQAQNAGSLGGCGRLRERSLQIRARGLGSSRRQCADSGLTQQVHEQLVPPCVDGEQVSRNRLERSTSGLEELRGPGVRQASPVGRDRVVDGRVKDGMHELERLARADQPGGRERIGRPDRRVVLDLRQIGGLGKPGLGAPHGDRGCELTGLRRKPPEPPNHRAGDRRGLDVGDVFARGNGRPDGELPKLVEHRAHEKRIAPGRGMDCLYELGLSIRSEVFLDQASGPRLAERSGSEQRRGVRRAREREFLDARPVGRIESDRQQNGQVLDAVGQVAQPAK